MARFYRPLAVLAFLTLGTHASAVEPVKPVASIRIQKEGEAHRNCQWLAFSPSGRLVAIRHTTPGSKDARLDVFEVATEKSVVSVVIKRGQGVNGEHVLCAFAPDNSWIAYGEGEELRFIALGVKGAKLPGDGRLKGPRAGPNATSVWLTADGKTAFFDSQAGGTGSSLRRIDLASGTGSNVFSELPDQPGQPDGIATAVTVNASAGLMAIALGAGLEETRIVECWTMGDKPARTTVKTPKDATAIAISPDGKLVAAGHRDGAVGWYRTDNGKSVAAVTPVERFNVSAVAFSPDGTRLAWATTARKGRHNVGLLDVASGKQLGSLDADSSGLEAVAYSPTGDRIATFGPSGLIQVWDVKRFLSDKP